MRIANTLAERTMVILMVLALTSLISHAQTSSTSPALQTYSTEVTVPLDQIGASPTPTIPPNILQAVQGGALEIRHQVTFTSSTNRLSVRTFLVAPQSPNPSPAANQTNVVESYEVNVESVLWAPTAVIPPGTTLATLNSLVITGRVAGGSTSLFGNLANKLFVHSTGFGSATPRTFNNITSIVSGLYTMYAQQGTGALTFSTQPGGGPGQPGPDGNEPPTVVVTAGMNATTALPEIQLDASGSTDPEGGALSFSWRSVGKSASIIGGNTSTPRVQFGEGFGEYTFEVTVTDAAGAFSTGQVRVTYVGR